MKRKPRKGEYVCRCYAYKFPHRFGGGRCKGRNIVEDYWEAHYGTGDCSNCISYEEGICQVVDGQEEVTECPVWQEFVSYEEIKIYKK